MKKKTKKKVAVALGTAAVAATGTVLVRAMKQRSGETVVRWDEDRWVVVDGGRRSEFGTKREAVAAGREQARERGGVLVIQRRDGSEERRHEYGDQG